MQTEIAFLVLKEKRKFLDKHYLLPVLKCTAILLFPVTKVFISVQILCIILALKRYFAIRVLFLSRPFFVFCPFSFFQMGKTISSQAGLKTAKYVSFKN